MKREESWNLSINKEPGADGPKSTPRKRTPKAAKKGDVDQNDDDDEDFDNTPTKKKATPLNKVKNGRVTKGNKGGARGAAMMDEDDKSSVIKPEDNYETSFTSINGGGHGGGYANVGNGAPGSSFAQNMQAYQDERAQDQQKYFAEEDEA